MLEVLRRHPRSVLLAAGARSVEIAFFNLLTTFLLGYATLSLGVARSSILALLSIGSLLTVGMIPAFGALSDRVGRRRVYLGGAMTATLVAAPACVLIDTGQLPLMFVGMLLMALAASAMFGPQATFFAELFSTRIRFTGGSLGFQLGAVLAGGLTPVVATALAAATGDLALVAVFMVGLGVITIGCTLALSGHKPQSDLTNRRYAKVQ